MAKEVDNQVDDFVKNIALQGEKRVFLFSYLINVAAYVGITFLLNSIRTTLSAWFLWVLIIIQLALYVSIFIKSYRRSIEAGFNRTLGYSVFFILAVLGRISNWEVILIPLLVITMLVISSRNKKLSHQMNKSLE